MCIRDSAVGDGLGVHRARARAEDGAVGPEQAQIANLADEIAYNAHDLDDGLRCLLYTSRCV